MKALAGPTFGHSNYKPRATVRRRKERGAEEHGAEDTRAASAIEDAPDDATAGDDEGEGEDVIGEDAADMHDQEEPSSTDGLGPKSD